MNRRWCGLPKFDLSSRSHSGCHLWDLRILTLRHDEYLLLVLSLGELGHDIAIHRALSLTLSNLNKRSRKVVCGKNATAQALPLVGLG
jgi:hypothetical protein